MKKFLLLLTLFCAMFSTVKATDVEIGVDDATVATSSYIPINALWKYGWSQQIYTAEEIGMAGTINSITFWMYHTGSNPPTYNISVYMAEVDEDAFASTSSWVTLSASDLVFSGTAFANLPNTAAGIAEVTIEFDTPFTYGGSSNLLIAFANNTGSYVSGMNARVFGASTDPKRTLYKYQDSGALGPDAPSATGTQTHLRNVIKLDVTPSGGGGPTCDKPETAEITDITANSAVLNISGGSQTYNVEIKGGQYADWAFVVKNTTNTSVQLADLASNTSYQVRVQSVCGDDASGYKNASFKTLIGLPYQDSIGVQGDWTKKQALLSDILAGGAFGTAAGSWNFGEHYGVLGGKHAYRNVFGTGCKDWIISPAIPLPEGGEYHLLFNVALTDYGNANPIDNVGNQPDDKFAALITTDNGATWNVLREWNNAGSSYVYDQLATEGEEVEIDLTAYAGMSIQVAFYCESTTSNGDNDLHVGNVIVEVTPSCLAPDSLAVVAVNTTKTSVQLDWNARSGETAWVLEYKKLGAENYTSIDINQKPYTLQNLEEFTEYSVRIAALCDPASSVIGEGISKFCKPIAIKTASGVPFVQSFDTATMVSEWVRYEALLSDVINEGATLKATTDGWNVAAANEIFTTANHHLVLNLSDSTSKYWIVGPTIEMVGEQQLTFDLAFTKADGNKQAVETGKQNSQKFYVFITTDGGANWTTLKQWDNAGQGAASLDGIKTEGQTAKIDLAEYATNSIQLAFYGESTNPTDASNNLHIANVKIDSIPACSKPTSLNITGIKGTTATAVWESEDDGLWQYGYVVKPTGDFVAADSLFMDTTSLTTFALTGLTETTHYMFFVRRICDNDTSEALVKEFATIQEPTELPYEHDFESANGWRLINGALENHWIWGEEARANNTPNGSKALYISNDNLGTYAYTKGTGKAAMVYAVKTFYFDQAGMYSFQYDWKCYGYSTYDYLRVALIPAEVELEAATAVPSGFSTTALPAEWKALDGGSKLNLDSAWNHQLVELTIDKAGYYQMVFAWRNYTYTSGKNPPAAVDNVKVARITCTKPSHLAYADLTATSVSLSWDEDAGNTFDYALIRADQDSAFAANPVYSEVPGGANAIQFDTLTECTFYKFYLRKACGGEDGNSDVISIEFQTKQIPAVVNKVFADDFESGAGWLFANNANNSWVIDTAAHKGGLKGLYVSQDGGKTNTYYKSTGGLIFAYKTFELDDAEYIFQYDWKAQGEGTSTIWDYLRVALVPGGAELNAVTGTTLPSGYSSTGLPTGWIALDGGYLNFSENEDWETVTSDAVAVTAGTYMVVFGWRWDGSGGTDPAAAIDNFSIRKVLCATPNNLSAPADSITTDSVFLKWEPQGAETTWLVRYKKASAEAWGEPIQLTADSLWLTNLDHSSNYEAQVAAWCDPTDEETLSEYSASVAFQTSCAALDTLVEDFENALVCWTFVKDASGYPVVLSNYPEDAYSGTKFLYFASDASDNPTNEYAILPELTTLEGMRIKFYARKDAEEAENVKMVVGVMTDPEDVTTFAAIDTIMLTTTTYTQFVVPFSAYTGEGKFVALQMVAASTNYALALVEDVEIESVPACVDPSDLRAESITHNSSIIYWAPQGDEINWLVRYKKSAAENWADTIHVTVDSLKLSNLAPATSYDVQVAAWCDPADAEATSPYSGSMSFKTMFGVPFEEKFATTTIPDGWSRDSALLVNVLAGTAQLTPLTSIWTFGTANGVFDSHAKINIYGTDRKHWLVTPAICVEGNTQLTFDLALTAYSGTLAKAAAAGEDEKFAVLVSANNGTTWSVIRQWDNAGSAYVYNNIATAGEEVVLDLSAYNGQTIMVAFYGESTVSGGDNNLHIDNVLIDLIPSCPTPTGLEAVLTKANGSIATLNWKAGNEETTWAVEYSRHADFSDSIHVEVYDSTLAIEGLMSDTTYYARVRALCGENDESAWGKTISFTPSDAIIVNDSTATNSYVPFYGYYVHYDTKSQFVVPASELEPIVWDTITRLTFYSSTATAALTGSEFEVYMAPIDTNVISTEKNWNEMEKVMSKAHLSVVDKQMVVTLSEPYQYTGGNLLIGFKLATKASSAGTTAYFYGKSNQTGASISGYASSSTGTVTMSQRNFLPKMKIDHVHGVEPTCIKVKDIAVSNITSSSAVLSWTKGSEDQNAWQIAIDSIADFNPNTAELIAANANTYALADLETETTYYVYVRANCSDGENEDYSVWSKVFTFKTASSCQNPDNVKADSISTTSALISWNTYGQTVFNLLYTDGTAAIDTIYGVECPYLLEGLEVSTAYAVKVQAACAEANQWSAQATFKTAYGVPFSEKFNASSIPADWTVYSGLMNKVLADSATLTATSGIWMYGTSNGVFDSHARINIYGTARYHWLTTPAVVLNENVQLTFDLALTAYSGTGAAAATTGTDDKFAVLVSTNDGEDWTVLRLWDNAGSAYVYNNIATAGEEVALDLSAYNGQSIIVAFYGESTVSNADNNLHIDNVLIDRVPTCLKPNGLSVSKVMGHKATISWTAAEGQDAWQIAYATKATEKPDTLANILNVTANPYVLENLDPSTTYYVYVRANCGEQDGMSKWTDGKSFKTTVACPAPTNLIAELTPGNGTIATLKWSAVGDEQSWRVEYSANANMSDSIAVVVYDTIYNITGLTAETTYYARVLADCGDLDSLSVYSTKINFTPTSAYTLTVNDGTKTNDKVPVYGNWVDNSTRSQFIIPEADLEELEWDSIKSLTFYASNASVNWGAAQFEVYLAEAPETTLSKLADWEALTLVKAAGSLSIADNKMVVTLDSAYQYQGGNLMIGFYQTVKGSYVATTWYGKTATGASFGGYGDNVTQQNFLPKMTIEYVPGVAPACPNPKNLKVVSVAADSAIFSWKAVQGASWEYAVALADADEPTEFNAVQEGENFVVVYGLNELTSYVFYLRRACGEDGNSELVSVPFETLEIAEEIANRYDDDFEAATGWKLVNGTETNAWMIGGTTSYAGDNALYISNDGASYAYDEEVASVTYATKLFRFVKTGNFVVSYSYKCVGEFNDEDGAIDYLRVALLPDTVALTAGVQPTGLAPIGLPNGWTALDKDTALVSQATWTRMSTTIAIPAVGLYRLAFIWINDDDATDGDPAAIDNLSIIHEDIVTGIESGAGIKSDAVKFIRNNHVYILVNGNVYDITGRKVELK